MNIQTAIQLPAPVKLTVAGFWMLKTSGAFASYSKAELLDGEIYGVPEQVDEEPESDASVPVKLRVEDYDALDRGRYLDEYGKTELVDGLVYQMSPQYRPHGFVKDELAYRLRRALEDLDSALHVATEQSVAIAPHSEPQPDIVLTSEPRGAGAIPSASVALAVEISSTTLDIDLGPKATICAQAGIAEYWVVDINGRVVQQMWTPQGSSYSQRHTVPFDERIVATTVPGLIVDLRF